MVSEMLEILEVLVMDGIVVSSADGVDFMVVIGEVDFSVFKETGLEDVSAVKGCGIREWCLFGRIYDVETGEFYWE